MEHLFGEPTHAWMTSSTVLLSRAASIDSYPVLSERFLRVRLFAGTLRSQVHSKLAKEIAIGPPPAGWRAALATRPRLNSQLG